MKRCDEAEIHLHVLLADQLSSCKKKLPICKKISTRGGERFLAKIACTITQFFFDA